MSTVEIIGAIVTASVTLGGGAAGGFKIIWNRICDRTDKVEQRFELHIEKLDKKIEEGEKKIEIGEQKHQECEKRLASSNEEHAERYLQVAIRLAKLESLNPAIE